MEASKSLTVHSFFTDLIFNPSHAKPEDQLKCKILTVALTVFSVGIIPALVSLSWSASRLFTWVQSSIHPTIEKASKFSPFGTASKISFEKGRGFPCVNENRKDEVRKITKDKIETLIDVKNAKVSKNSLTEAGKKELLPVLKHCKFIPAVGKAGNSFINEGDIIQTVAKMEFDENFQPMSSKNLFYMHSTPAPNAKNGGYRLQTTEGRKQYLDDMESVIHQALTAQINSGSKHILWNYFGMGAFLRNAISNPVELNALRLEIAKRFVVAFDRAVSAMDVDKRKDFKFYLTGPTGESASFPASMRNEPKSNYDAFVEAFKGCKCPENVTFCPETDAYVKGQQLADTYNVAENEVAPVSVINAADPKLLGNHWYNGFSANFAIDENAHRRSSVMSGLSLLVNGGYESNGNCKNNIEALSSPSASPSASSSWGFLNWLNYIE